MARFVAQGQDDESESLIAIDIGYSTSRPTCGLATSRDIGSVRRKLTFGAMVDEVVELLTRRRDHPPIVIIEAPLSTCHEESGNPKLRGTFEVGRPWWVGAGATVTLAAQRLLGQLASRLPSGGAPIPMAEAFLSNKQQATCHLSDARIILERFSMTKPERLEIGTTGLMRLTAEPPPVRVFNVGRTVDGK